MSDRDKMKATYIEFIREDKKKSQEWNISREKMAKNYD